MGTFSIWHWLVVLAIVVLVFGTKKLRNLGSDLGNAVKGFKEGMKGNEGEQQEESSVTQQQIVNRSTEETVIKKRARLSHKTFSNFH